MKNIEEFNEHEWQIVRIVALLAWEGRTRRIKVNKRNWHNKYKNFDEFWKAYRKGRLGK